jgi:Domain of unknown function (DUF4333)
MSSFRPLAAVAAVGAAVMLLGACSGSVSRSDLEARVASELFEALGVHPDVSCEGDLPGEVDATTTCSAIDPDSGDELTFEATVTQVDGSDVWYRIALAD